MSHIPKYEKFETVREELERQHRTFDAESLKRITYGNLILATCGNAASAMCKSSLVQKEKERRIESIKNTPVDQITAEIATKNWTIFDDEYMVFGYYSYLAKDIKLTEKTTPKWRELVFWMQSLRGDWSGGSNNPFLGLIYKLIPEAIAENIVPVGWCHAVKLNADDFAEDGGDGRIMRDGQLHLPEEIAKTFNLPQNVAGNLMKALGAVPVKRDGYRGSYDELFEDLLTHEQRIVYCAEAPWLEVIEEEIR